MKMKVITAIFAAAGLLALGYCAFEYVSAQRFQTEEIMRFAEHRQTEHRQTDQRQTDQRQTEKPQTETEASQPAPAERPYASAYPSTGSPVAILTIPRLGLSAIVVEGADERELKLGPGHIPGTPLPGDGGNAGVAGHRDTFFRPLRFARVNDTIQVATSDRDYLYKIVSIRIVAPENVQVLNPTPRETLTLITCYPFDFVGAAPKRFIVRADCINCGPAGS